ncbi:MAG: hypothetical protein COA47_14445 [Robiginitomaculum sp.]|nr:MAG: hypothetical protein COA47_14445 [Robiginitomaculum sp.]
MARHQRRDGNAIKFRGNQMKNSLLVGVIIASFFVSFQAKADDVNVYDYVSVKAAITVSTDEFDGTTTIAAPAIDIVGGKDVLGGDAIYPVTLSYRTHISGTKTIFASLFIVYTDRTWKKYHSVHRGGQSYDLVDVLSQVQSCYKRNCIFSEIKRLPLRRQDLNSAVSVGGFKFKVSGQMDSFIVDIPAPYIKAFLEVIDENSVQPN